MKVSNLDLHTTELAPHGVAEHVSAGPAEASMRSRRARFRSLIRNRPSGADAGEAELVEALDAEVTLLREENARLRAARESAPDPGQVLVRLSELRGRSDDADTADDAWHVLTAGMVLRDTLLEVCGEIGQAMAVQEERLRSMTAELGIEAATTVEAVTELPPAISG